MIIWTLLSSPCIKIALKEELVPSLFSSLFYFGSQFQKGKVRLGTHSILTKGRYAANNRKSIFHLQQLAFILIVTDMNYGPKQSLRYVILESVQVGSQ